MDGISVARHIRTNLCSVLVTELKGGIVKGARSEPSAITAGEERVLRLISQSRTNREIAAALCISPATVKRHVENILRKLQLRNRVEAAIYGLLLGGCPVRNQTRCPLANWRNATATET
jgi:DNA-binding NarL/FixJ family response regulator